MHSSPVPTPSATTEADAVALLDEIGREPAPPPSGERHVAWHRYRRRAALRDPSWPTARRRDSSGWRSSCARIWIEPTPSTPPGSPHATRTSVEVVRSAYATSLEGFALPYGDVTVGGWRNTPYVVIQNVGAYLDVPRFLDSDHRIENAADAEAYLARLQSYAKQLDGELGRMQAARGSGLVPPAFLIDKALAQMRAVREERPRRRHARRVTPAADEKHPGQLGRARARDRGAGDRAGARAADRGAAGPARRGHG